MAEPTNAEKKERRVEPRLPSGFRDYGPQEQIAKQMMTDTIRTVFERFGFDPIETPAVERTEVLTGGEEESSKIIFNVKGSQEEESDESLRFDLTVPLARFLAANPKIPKPFKRYQIGKVWRGERAQQGRYREFTQADVDIVGASSLDADAEIIMIIYSTLTTLGINNFVININSRNILNGLPELAGFSPEKLGDALRILDKQDKISASGVVAEFEKFFGRQTAEQIGIFLQNTKEGGDALISLAKDPAVEKGYYDLTSIRACLKNKGIDDRLYIKFEPSMVRGLSYYTGLIFETVLTDLPEIGSIFSGGRYDNLVMRFTGQPIPAVGASLGVDRLFAACEKLDLLEMTSTTAEVIIFNLSPAFSSLYAGFAKTLRDAGVNTMEYVGDDRTFQAQLAYAAKKNIPFVLIYGDAEKDKGLLTIRNMVERTQEEIPVEKLVEYFQ